MTVIASGTLTPAGASEEQFSGADVTTTGSLVLYVDLNAMALGDQVILRAKRNVLTGGTIRTVFPGNYSNTGNDIAASIPINNEFDASFTVEYLSGTPVALPWSIESL